MSTASQEAQLRFLRQSARLEESGAPKLVRSGMLSLPVLVFAFIAWAGLAEIEEIAQAPGEVVPNGLTRVVQHFDGGIVREILVREGSEVRPGQALVRLDGAGSEEELQKALIARIGLEHAAATARDLLFMQQQLKEKGLTSQIRYLETKKSSDLAESELRQQGEIIARLQARVDRLEVRAPIEGVVKGIKLNTIGEVVKSGDPLMEIVPTGERLVVDARIAAADIGHVAVGQKVKVKVSSFDYGRFGAVDGILELLTATTFEAPDGEKYYRGRIALAQGHVGNHPHMRILPGMTVRAGIITGRKSILAYLAKPVQRALEDGLSEK